jgi:putative resolvase
MLWKITPERTPKGHRRYDIAKLRSLVPARKINDKYTIAYARVASYDQTTDLHRQIAVLESFCAKNGWTFNILQDLGSGLNYSKKGLKKLIKQICSGCVEQEALKDAANEI